MLVSQFVRTLKLKGILPRLIAYSMSDAPEPSETEDADLRMLNAKRMLEIRKRVTSSIAKKELAQKTSAEEQKRPSDREVLLGALTERGDEVLASAEASYPSQTKVLIPQLARLVREGKVSTIGGGELLQFFRSIGMRVSVNTSISVQEHGRFVSLSDKLKRDES